MQSQTASSAGRHSPDDLRALRLVEALVRAGANGRTAPATRLQRDQLEITVGVGPDSGLSLASELRLVRVALLYADRVLLCSPRAAMVLAAHTLRGCSLDEKMRLFRDVGPIVAENPAEREAIAQAVGVYTDLRGRRRLHPVERRALSELEGKLRVAWGGIETAVSQLLPDGQVDDLLRAMESGRLRLHTFQAQDTEEMTAEYVRIVSQALTSGQTHPLVDDQTGNLVQSLAGLERQIETTTGTRLRHVALAADLFDRLPRFELAAMDEILDITEELKNPLVRFRGAMIAFSAAIRSAPWDDEFAHEADLIYREKVAPAVVDLEEAVQSNRYARELVGRLVAQPIVPQRDGAVGLLVAQLGAFPALAHLAMALGTGLGAVALAYDTWRSTQDRASELEQNQLYYFYKLRTRWG